MWYLAEILFAESKTDGRRIYVCESCDVLFQAPSAVEAYNKAMEWGRARAAEEPATMDLLGVSHLTTIDEEPGNGVEICGRYFRKRDVWDRVPSMVPPSEELRAIVWERNRDAPIGEILHGGQISLLRRVMRGRHDESGRK